MKAFMVTTIITVLVSLVLVPVAYLLVGMGQIGAALILGGFPQVLFVIVWVLHTDDAVE
jgi:hypothetical protein